MICSGVEPWPESMSCNISNTRQCFIGYPNNEKRVEDTTCNGVFFTKFEVFG